MPVLNGLQAAPILRAMHPKTQIILYTLYADSVVEHEAHLAGISSLVGKGDGSSQARGLSPVGVEKLGSKTLFPPQGSFFRFVFFLR